jgi:protein-glutamine gamma-glutamyltransferase
MSFEKLFRVLSYAAVFCGFLSLWISGTFGLFGTSLFIGIMALAWLLEDSRWQISERVGTVLIVLAMPLYYLLAKYQFFYFATTEAMLPGILARLILTLSAIKLLQKKSDRDWIFLYVMAFFQVLLAAGLSISAMYLVSFVAFVLVMVCTIILFEIKKTDSVVNENATIRRALSDEERLSAMPVRRLPGTAILLIFAIIAIAAPTFFLLPRVGGAGIGGGQGGISTSSGFSDTVRLGGIGRIQENQQVVMRVRIEEPAERVGDLRWRGIALDTFDNQSWKRSRAAFREVRERGDRDVIQVDYPSSREGLVVQTFYLEPLDSPNLFVLPRAVGVQGNFNLIFRDAHNSLSFHSQGERVTYKVISDVVTPPLQALRNDQGGVPRTMRNYLQLPDEMDPRIPVLVAELIAGTDNKFDAAARIEQYLQNEFGYTLEQKAGGDEPLADFLFNVREGHCEYFATAMAVMLRTQGIATRVVNGFQRGEYNETADAWVVRQANAHSWVEVYFPAEDAWITFDPTPFAGQNVTDGATGIAGTVGKYLEALEMIWIQYFVAFDNQEQRSLFTSIRRGMSDYNAKASSWIGDFQDVIVGWWKEVKGDSGTAVRATAIAYGATAVIGIVLLVLVFVWLYRKIVELKVWQRFRNRLFAKQRASIVEFYERMQKVLDEKGITREPHQTPLEFAYALEMPQAVKITERYNRVRFGEQSLSAEESAQIESWLTELRETSDLSK